VWTTLPSLDLPLIGREEAWRQLETAYGTLQKGGVIFIAGEPGIGKSRLLQEFATAQSDRWLLTGHSQEATRDLPYQPLIHALRQALARPALWAAIPPIWLAEATRLLPELSVHFPDLPAPIQLEPRQALARLYEAVTQIFFALAAQQPLLLCLDDLHWADDGTLGWLHALSARLSGSHLCLLVTYRSEDSHGLQKLHESLGRAGLRAVVPLSGLSVAAVTAILRQLPAKALAVQNLAAAIQRATAGNPFFALETIRVLWESNQLTSPPQTLPLPGSVQEAIHSRLARLTPIARQILDAAAVLAPFLDFAALQATAGRSEPELLDGLDELVAHHLLQEAPAGLRFYHDLTRAVVYDELSSWRRLRLHRRAALVLVTRHQRDPGSVAAQAAHHYDAAGEVALALEWYARAADAAQRQYAHQEAADLLQRAIALLDGVPEDKSVATRLHESLGDSLVVSGQLHDADAAYRAALAHCPVGDRLWLVALCQKRLRAFPGRGEMAGADVIYQEALDYLGPEPGELPAGAWWHAWLDLQLGRYEFLYFRARLDEMEETEARLASIVEQFGTIKHRLDHYSMLNMRMLRQKRYNLSNEDMIYMRKAIALAAGLDDQMKLASLDFGFGFCLLWAGKRDQARDYLLRSLNRATDFAYFPLQNQCLVYLTIAARLAGDVAQARRYQARSAAVARQVGTPSYVGAAAANQAWLHYCDGQWDLATASARQAQTHWQQYAYPFHWLAHWPLLAIALARDDVAAAVASAAAMLDPVQHKLPDDLTGVLQDAVGHWHAGKQGAARPLIAQALELAQAAHYL
jgi:hypothetical protein